MLSEQKLSNTLRIQIIEEIAEVDLPWFMFLEIDAALSMLNYFKLTNLKQNLDQYMGFLFVLADEYNEAMKKTCSQFNAKINTGSDSAGFLTDYLISQWVHVKLSQQKLVRIESVYRVKCLLKMKEYINRRILKEKKFRDQTIIDKKKKQ